MDDSLRPVSTAYKVDDQIKEVHLVEVKKQPQSARKIQSSIEKPKTPEESLETLKSEPDFPSLGGVLKYLNESNDINLHFPSPIGSQMINVLVSDIVPNYWSILSEQKKGKGGWSHGKERHDLLQVLTNVSGLGAIVAKLKALVEESRRTERQIDSPNIVAMMSDYLGLLESVLENKYTLRNLHDTLSKAPHGLKQALWQELRALIGGSRVLSVSAEAQSLVNTASKTVEKPIWVADGMRYSAWISQSLVHWASNLSIGGDNERWDALCTLMRKSMRLGYPGHISNITMREPWLMRARCYPRSDYGLQP